MAAPQLEQIDLVSKDLNKSIVFYRALGLKIPKDAVWSGKTKPHHATIRLPNGIDISLSSPAIARAYNKSYRGKGGSELVIGFSVKTRRAVDALYAKMTKAGYKGASPPWDAFWGARYAIIADPDGNLVGLMSPVDPKKRYPGPDV